MTAKDVTATYEADHGFYMDNSNVWFINLDSGDDMVFKALTMIFNSTVFSVLAKSGAIALRGGYYKFNKQYLNPVPLPNEKLVPGNLKIRELADYYEELTGLQEKYEKAEQHNKIYFKSIMEHKWEKVDRICNEFYGLDVNDWTEIEKVGRVVDRVTGKEG